MAESKEQARGLIGGKPGESMFFKGMFAFPSENELPELFRKVEGMNDHRLLAIITALLIENRIDKLLRVFLPKYSKLLESKEFSFSVKITLLEALNLIPPRVTTACHSLRRVRNEFAHHLEKKDFADIDNKCFRAIRALRDEAYRVFTVPRQAAGKDAPDEAEQPLMDVFKQLSFFCICALDQYSINVKILREHIEQPAFVEGLHAEAESKSMAWIKEATAGTPFNVERQGELVIEHFEGGVANVRHARPEDIDPVKAACKGGVFGVFADSSDNWDLFSNAIKEAIDRVQLNRLERETGQ